jgi:hypothetical protein
MLVAHACNPNYSGGRDQEYHGSKSSSGKYFTRPYVDNPSQKRTGGVV